MVSQQSVADLSVTDLRVAGANIDLFGLLWRLPAGLVLDFLEQANAWEMRHSLARRLASTVEMVATPIAQTPALRDRSDQVARECAEFFFRSNAALSALLVQLERGTAGPLEVQWQGVDNLRRAREGGRPVVVFAPHIGFLYAVPFALAVLGERSVSLTGEMTGDVLTRVFSTMAPKLIESTSYILVPSPGCARAATDTLWRGGVLVVFPEVNYGATGNVQAATTTFLGRTVWLPTMAARFARIARADILPVLVTPDGPRRVRVELDDPVAAPADRHADVATSVRLFRWLERVIEERPHLWWGWPLLDTKMRVAEVAAGRT